MQLMHDCFFYKTKLDDGIIKPKLDDRRHYNIIDHAYWDPMQFDDHIRFDDSDEENEAAAGPHCVYIVFGMPR